MAERIILIPLGILGGVVSKIVFKEFADKQAASQLQASEFYAIWRIMALIGVVPMLATGLLGQGYHSVFPGGLNGKWRNSSYCVNLGICSVHQQRNK